MCSIGRAMLDNLTTAIFVATGFIVGICFMASLIILKKRKNTTSNEITQ